MLREYIGGGNDLSAAHRWTWARLMTVDLAKVVAVLDTPENDGCWIVLGQTTLPAQLVRAAYDDVVRDWKIAMNAA